VWGGAGAAACAASWHVTDSMQRPVCDTRHPCHIQHEPRKNLPDGKSQPHTAVAAQDSFKWPSEALAVKTKNPSVIARARPPYLCTHKHACTHGPSSIGRCGVQEGDGAGGMGAQAPAAGDRCAVRMVRRARGMCSMRRRTCGMHRVACPMHPSSAWCRRHSRNTRRRMRRSTPRRRVASLRWLKPKRNGRNGTEPFGNRKPKRSVFSDGPGRTAAERRRNLRCRGA
jgi:hypothetical protein